MLPERTPSPDLPGQLTDADFTLLRELARQRAGLVIEPGREYFIEMRMAVLASEEGYSSPAHIVEALRTEETWGQLHRRVTEALAICETSWFRDAHPFDALRREWLPELLRKRVAAGEIRVWSAACASGQEPYSFAMMWREHFQATSAARLVLLATDFSQTMLRRARAGSYSQIEVNRGLPATQLVRNFRKSGTDWQLRDEVRSMVEFRDLNLVGPWPIQQTFDLVLLRNVLLYFEPATRRAVIARVREHLAPDGLLVLGAGETTLGMEHAFESLTLGRAVVHRPRAAFA